MKKIYFTPGGDITKELTKAEVEALALDGDKEAKKELLKDEIKIATTNSERLDAIEKYLGV
jgi:Arc/MetJ family transcription regulator